MPFSRLPRQAYEMTLRMPSVNANNWCAQIKSCFDRYGYSEVWLNGGVGDEQAFLRQLKQRMLDCYIQDWHTQLHSCDRYDQYRTFKSSLKPENIKLKLSIAILF